jgi:hypothetical protein
VNWVAVCSVTKRALDDPIVFPGQPGRSHDHTFSGSLAINASSTAEELLRSGTNCTNSGDRSSYWMPAHTTEPERVTRRSCTQFHSD